MTKEITKAYILQEIQDKLKLREFEPAVFSFQESVVPIYDIDQHLGKYEVIHSTVSITSAAAFIFFTVPQTERWTLRSYQIIFGMTGAHKGTGLLISNRPTGVDSIYLDMVKGQEISYLTVLPIPVILVPGNRLVYLIDTYVSTQNLTIDIDVRKEEIR